MWNFSLALTQRSEIISRGMSVLSSSLDASAPSISEKEQQG